MMRYENYTPVYEISNERTINGRRPIKVILHEIHPDAGVFQFNGISWSEQYVRENMQSIVGMSLCAEFLSEDRDVPYGHGMTDVRNDMALFEDATMVGHFERAYIDDVVLEGETKRVLIAEGTLDEQRYPNFVTWVRDHMQSGTVRGSVEISGRPENDNRIIYADGWKEEGRVPMVYDYTGYAILSIKPADNAAVVMELNNRKNVEKEELAMNEEMKLELQGMIQTAISEMNASREQYESRIDELETQLNEANAALAERDNEIAELNSQLEQARNDLASREAEMGEITTEVESLRKERAVSELNAALAEYTEDQREYAHEEIEAYNNDPGCMEINSIIGKICTEMVRKSRETNVDTESAIDVFGAVEQPKEDDAEIDIF